MNSLPFKLKSHRPNPWCSAKTTLSSHAHLSASVQRLVGGGTLWNPNRTRFLRMSRGNITAAQCHSRRYCKHRVQNNIDRHSSIPNSSELQYNSESSRCKSAAPRPPTTYNSYKNTKQTTVYRITQPIDYCDKQTRRCIDSLEAPDS